MILRGRVAGLAATHASGSALASWTSNANSAVVKRFTRSRPVVRHGLIREEAQRLRSRWEGTPEIPASASPDPKVFEMQEEVFGYTRGGDGVRSGRKILRKKLNQAPLMGYYPIDMMAYLTEQKRKIKKNPQYFAARAELWSFENKLDVNKYGPFLPNDPYHRRMEFLTNQQDLDWVASKPTPFDNSPEFVLTLDNFLTGNGNSEKSVLREDKLTSLKKRGKGPPKKGQGKRALKNKGKK